MVKAAKGSVVGKKQWKEFKTKQKMVSSDPLRGLRTRINIADCTTGFAIANRNPFAAYEGNCPPVCMPDNIVLPTFKERIIAKGSGSTGTTGVGYVGFAPNVVTNNGTALFITTSTSVGTLASTPAAFTAQGVINYVTSKFANADMGAGLLESRVCAAGVRVRYTGTTLNSGGTVYAYRSPSNSVISGVILNTWISLPETKKFPLGKEWINLRWRISTPDEQNFDFSTTSLPCMYLAVVSATGAAVPFECECVNFHELVGSSSGAKTISHSDPVGFGAVQAIATSQSDSNKGRGEHPKSIMEKVAGYIKQGTSYVTQAQQAYVGGKALYEAGSSFASLLGSGSEAGMAAIAEEAGAMALMVL